MKQLISAVKDASLQASRASCSRTFLDHTIADPNCQRIVQRMQDLTPEQLGCSGSEDPYHFDGPLNRVTVTGENAEDYRLVLFFIKKGTRMPLHDHPNMSVFFRLVFGQLNYTGYDKVEEKFKYNAFSDNEYEELLETRKVITAKKSRLMTLKEGSQMYVRPSANNMHEFIAQENSCFFDICLPNYTPNSCSRKITYFKEQLAEPKTDQQNDAAKPLVDVDILKNQAGYTKLVYDTTPPVMPTGFSVIEKQYRGVM